MHINKSKTLPEIFETVNKLESKEEKIELLKLYDTKHMRWLVDFIYNTEKDDLYIPPYQKNNRPPEICNTSIGRSLTRINSAIRIRRTNTERAHRKYRDLMTIVLQEVSKDEAKLLEDVFNGKKITGIHKSVWKAVYPEFFRNEDSSQ